MHAPGLGARRQRKELGRILTHNILPLLLSEIHSVLRQQLLGPRPGGICVGEVTGPQELFVRHLMQGIEGGEIVLERHPDIALDIFTGQL